MTMASDDDTVPFSTRIKNATPEASDNIEDRRPTSIGRLPQQYAVGANRRENLLRRAQLDRLKEAPGQLGADAGINDVGTLHKQISETTHQGPERRPFYPQRISAPKSNDHSKMTED
jgi:hypothetical protein